MTIAAIDTSSSRSEMKLEQGFESESSLESNHNCKSVKILDYTNHRFALEKDKSLAYTDIINFEKGSSPCSVPNQSRCVMCGITDALIPTQNKNVCKSCDSVPWLVKCPAVVVKFCKGCKNFVILADFFEKPGAAKCAKCRLRGRNNYLKSKKNTLVEFKNETDSESLATCPEEEESENSSQSFLISQLSLPSENKSMHVLGINVSGIDVAVFESLVDPCCSSLSVPLGSDLRENSIGVLGEIDSKIFENQRRKDMLSTADASMSDIADYSSFPFMSAESPMDHTDPMSMSCSSTYNPNCNYSTSRRGDLHSDLIRDFKNEFPSDSNGDMTSSINLNVNLNTEGRGRTRMWSNVDSETVSIHRPPHPHTKKTKGNSTAKGCHHNVHFHLPDSAAGSIPLSLSSLTKPSPAFALSPFLSFCLSETLLDSATRPDGTEMRLEPVLNPPSAPTSPQFPSSRPPSSQLVDRWQWDPDSNPLMQLVRATETFSPHSPYKFSPYKRSNISSPKRYSPNYERYFLPGRQAGSGCERVGLRVRDERHRRDGLVRVLLDTKITLEKQEMQREEVMPMVLAKEKEVEKKGDIEAEDGEELGTKEGSSISESGKMDNPDGVNMLTTPVIEVEGVVTDDCAICVDKGDIADKGSIGRREEGDSSRDKEGFFYEGCSPELSLKAEMFAAVSVSFRELSRLYKSIPSSSPAPSSSYSSSSSTSSVSSSSSAGVHTSSIFCNINSTINASTFSKRYLSNKDGHATPSARYSGMDDEGEGEGEGVDEGGEEEDLTTTEDCSFSDKESGCPLGKTNVEENREDNKSQSNQRPTGKKKDDQGVSLFSASNSCSTSPAESTTFGSQRAPRESRDKLSFDCHLRRDHESNGKGVEEEEELSLPALALEELEQWYLKWAEVMEGVATE